MQLWENLTTTAAVVKTTARSITNIYIWDHVFKNFVFFFFLLLHQWLFLRRLKFCFSYNQWVSVASYKYWNTYSSIKIYDYFSLIYDMSRFATVLNSDCNFFFLDWFPYCIFFYRYYYLSWNPLKITETIFLSKLPILYNFSHWRNSSFCEPFNKILIIANDPKTLEIALFTLS